MQQSLTIGEFAQLTHLSVRTLRRYHESGLLAPATVDPSSGYRHYASTQIPSAQVIHRLRELDVPLAEVGEILATEDPAARAELIAGHLERLEAQLDRTRAAVASLRQLLRPDVEELQVRLRSRPARTVTGISGTVDLADVLAWYDAAMTELDEAVAGRPASGPAGGRYANELITVGRGDVLVYYPAAAPPAGGRVAPVVLPPVELATAVHHGPPDDIDVTYGRLGAWVVEHALAVDGPIYETYLAGPRDDRSRVPGAPRSAGPSSAWRPADQSRRDGGSVSGPVRPWGVTRSSATLCAAGRAREGNGARPARAAGPGPAGSEPRGRFLR